MAFNTIIKTMWKKLDSLGVTPLNYLNVIQWLSKYKEENNLYYLEDIKGQDRPLKKGGYLVGNGIDRYVDLSTITGNNGDSIHYIEFIRGNNVDDYVFSSRIGGLGGVSLFIDGSGNIRIIVGGSLGNSPLISGVTEGDYVKLAITYDLSANLMSYVCKINDTDISGSFNPSLTYTAGQPYILFNRWESLGVPSIFWASDKITRLVIYNRLLTDEEVDKLINGDKDYPKDNRLGDFDFEGLDPTVDSTLYDKSGNNNHGTLYGETSTYYGKDVNIRSYRNENGYNLNTVSDGVDDMINTGLFWTNDTQIEFGGRMLGNVGSLDKLFGTTADGFRWIGVSSGNFYAGLGGGNVGNFFAYDEDYHVFKYDLVNLKASIDTTELPITDNFSFGSNSIMRFFSQDNAVRHAPFALSYLKIWQGGNLVRNYAPQDNGTLLDIVNNVVYENDAPDDFGTVGIPRLETQVNIDKPVSQQVDVLGNNLQYFDKAKYNAQLVQSNVLRANGTNQYIPTGILNNQNNRLEFEFIPRDISSTQVQGSNSCWYGWNSSGEYRYTSDGSMLVDLGSVQVGNKYKVIIDWKNNTAQLSGNSPVAIGPIGAPALAQLIEIFRISSGFYMNMDLLSYNLYTDDVHVLSLNATEGNEKYLYNEISGHKYSIMNYSASVWQKSDLQKPNAMLKGFSPALSTDGTDDCFRTKIRLTSDHVVKMGIILKNITETSCLFGARTAPTTKAFNIFNFSNNLRCDWGNEQGIGSLTGFQDGDYLEIEMGRGAVKFNGNTVVNFTQQTFVTDFDMFITCLNNGGTGAFPASKEFVFMQVLDANDDIVGDFIPVVQGTYFADAGRAEHNGFYDRISKEFIYTDGEIKNTPIVQIPAKLGSTTETVFGTELLNKSSKIGLNGSETQLKQPEVFQLIDVNDKFDYTPWFGAEQITNGDFENGSTGWSLGTGWSISDGKARNDGTTSGSPLSQSALTVGKTYEIIFEVSDFTTGTLDLRLRNGGSGALLNLSSAGIHRVTFTAIDTSIQYVALSGNTAEFSIDNVSIKEVGDTSAQPYPYNVIAPDYENKGNWFNDVYYKTPTKFNSVVYKTSQLGELIGDNGFNALRFVKAVDNYKTIEGNYPVVEGNYPILKEGVK